MTLTRIWTPTSYYSSGGSKRILVIHTMEGFTGSNGAYDCAAYFQGNVGASSHVCIDNNRGTIWEGVSRGNSAWTQCNYNSAAISCEQSGYASWSRQYWLDNRSNQLHNIADWLAEESGKTGIPLTDISSSAAQGSGRGVCYHSELGSSGCGHSDPGSGFPLDKVLEWAKGGSEAAPSGGDFMPSSVYADGKLHLACVWTDGRVNYRREDESWYAVDPVSANKAKSGADITVTPGGTLIITYTNSAGKVCTWQKAVDAPKSDWGWYDRGGSAR